MSRFTLIPVIALTLAAETLGYAGGAACPCINYPVYDLAPNSIENVNGVGQLAYRPTGPSGPVYYYPVTYGSSTCTAHDQNQPPVCNDAQAPGWCKEQWCYVDKANCNSIVSRSKFFPNEKTLYYSYSTCNEGAASNSFDKWAASNVDATAQMAGLIQDYLVSSRLLIEESFSEIGTGTLSSACGYTSMCPCTECVINSMWNKKIDSADVGFWLNGKGSANDQNQATCLSQAIAFTYTKVAATEGNESRVGYQYFGDQSTGSYAGWPNIDWCPSGGYDSRYRPWYAAGSTGPKDVVIVIDVSGSMATAGRDALAKTAAKAVLDTLTWKDHATIVQFDGDVIGVFSKTMVSITDAQRVLMKAWITRGDGARGGTNFEAALLGEDDELPGAYKIIRDSVLASKTSMCQKVIMFLTDGTAGYSEDSYRITREKSVKDSVSLFTYALGSGADVTVAKRLACENNGIFYPVADGGDLGTIMADYYKYFSAGQDICTASFTEYIDTVTGTQLYAGCLPIYDRRSTQSSLLGVSCMDINMVANLAAMKAQPGWRDMIAKMSDMTKMCKPLFMSSCQLEKLRAAVGSGSRCENTQLPATCPCQDSSCQDDTVWLDEKGYFCDTWIGDNCQQAAAQFGYTQAGQDEVTQKCKKSCNLCEVHSTCPYTSAASCSAAATKVPDTARACLTEKLSGVDIEGCFMSCGDKTSALYSAKQNCDTLASNTARLVPWIQSVASLAMIFTASMMM